VSLNGQYAPVGSRRFIALAAVVGVIVLSMRACGAERPEYDTASAIAAALNAHDIPCTYASTTPSSLSSDVESSGVCSGDDFNVHLFVFRDSEARKESQSISAARWCSEGVREGSYVAADRWLVTMDALPTNEWLHMNDIANATGGERFPQECG
jgi:hypothetical protein